MQPNHKQTARARYELLATEREPYLKRARECSKLTIPHLLPPETHSGSSDLYVPYQSVGSRGVNHLSAKLMLALFPPGGSFFRLTLDSFVLEELARKAVEAGVDVQDARADFEMALSQVEEAVITRLEQRGYRPVLNEALKHLQVAGNVLIHVLPDGGLQLFKLDSYVVKRDREGNVLEIIVHEAVARDALPEKAKALLRTQVQDQDEPTDNPNVDLYTRIYRDGDKFRVYQEVEGSVVPGSEGTYPLTKAAWLPLRWTSVAGEDYGRSYVEEYIGDLRSLEVLTKAVVRFSAVAARVLIFVDESGMTAKEDVAEAESGDVVEGRAEDVTVLQLDKYADFRVASEIIERIEQRLEQAFLLYSSIQRHAERVTAEEIRVMATEIEQSLGGTYSLLAGELQYPLVVRVMAVMQRGKQLPPLPEGSVEPQIVAGLEGLGRSSDLTKLQALLATVTNTLGPNAVQEYVNPGAAMKRIAASLGVDIEGLVKTDEEVQQARMAAQQQQMAERIGPAAMNTATKVAEMQLQQGA